MRFALAALLALTSGSSTSTGCAGKANKPESGAYDSVELHVWSKGKKGQEQYWVTQLGPRSGCVSQRHVDPSDGITYDLRDCSLADMIRPRVAELVAVFEVDAEPQPAGERVDTSESDGGHAVIFVRADGTRWTSSSTLLDAGAKLLDAKLAELSMIGPGPTTAAPTAGGWTELSLRDKDEVLRRQLAADGRWSCESWLMSETSLDHYIVTRRGQIDPSEAATLIDSVATGITGVDLDDESKWGVTLVPGEGDVFAVRSDRLVGLWDTFAAQLDPACRLDPPPTLAEL